MASKPNKVNRPWVSERKPFERDNSNNEFYNSWTWRKLRKMFIDKNPLCVRCELKGLTIPAYVVDHIVPINKGGSKTDESNLQSLCEKCHNSKSSSESRGYGV